MRGNPVGQVAILWLGLDPWFSLYTPGVRIRASSGPGQSRLLPRRLRSLPQWAELPAPCGTKLPLNAWGLGIGTAVGAAGVRCLAMT